MLEHHVHVISVCCFKDSFKRLDSSEYCDFSLFVSRASRIPRYDSEDSNAPLVSFLSSFEIRLQYFDLRAHILLEFLLILSICSRLLAAASACSDIVSIVLVTSLLLKKFCSASWIVCSRVSISLQRVVSRTVLADSNALDAVSSVPVFERWCSSLRHNRIVFKRSALE